MDYKNDWSFVIICDRIIEKPIDYVNVTGVDIWVISHEHPGMVTRTSVIFVRKTVLRLSPSKRFWLHGFVVSKLQCHFLSAV